MGAGFGAPPATSVEAGALREIDSRTKTFVNKDFVKNMAWLNQSVDTLSAYTQKLQAGVDSANRNTIEQVQGIIADLLALFSGGPTGIDFGDFKYILQALRAMLGIDPDTPFPLNIFQAIKHMLQTYIIPQEQFTDVIFDAIIAWAETLGFSDNAVASIEEFDDAVISFYHGMDELKAVFGEMMTTLFKAWGLGTGHVNLQGLRDFWDSLRGFIDNITAGPHELLMNVLSAIVTFIFKSMTWFVNVLNPSHILEHTGVKFIGPQLVPDVSGATTDWTVGSNVNTGWVYDSTNTHNGTTSTGSFKTVGNNTSKRLLTQKTTPATPGIDYYLSGWVKWEDVPATINTFGICIVFYSGANEVTQVNVDIDGGHGATGGWSMINQIVVVPQNCDGFKVGCRVSSTVYSGTIWVDEISCTEEQPIGVTWAQGILDWPRKALQRHIDRLDQILTTLFGEDNVLSEILANVIPALDASKIRTGQFKQHMVEGLEDAIQGFWDNLNGTIDRLGQLSYDLWYHPAQTIGQIGQNMVTNLQETIQSINDWIQDVIDKIRNVFTGGAGTGHPIQNMVSGIEDFFQGLFGQKQPKTTIISAAVPTLDATKISSGILPATTIPSLDASKITTGTLINDVIPTPLDGSKIPSLDASKITTGQLDTSQVKDLEALLNAPFTGRADNLCTNPGFENASFPIRTMYGKCSYTTSLKYSGERAVRVQGSDAIFLVHDLKWQKWIPCAPGDTFYVEGMFYSDSYNGAAEGSVQFIVETSTGSYSDPNGWGLTNFLSSDDFPEWATWEGGTERGVDINKITKGQWVKLWGFYTVPAGVKALMFRVETISTVPGTAGTVGTNFIYYWDDVCLYRVTETEKINRKLFNESTPSDTVLAQVIPGFDASKIISGTLPQDQVAFLREDFSTLRISLKDSENLISNGSFEDNPIPWNFDPVSDWGQNKFYIDNTVSRSGTRSLKIGNTYWPVPHSSGWQNNPGWSITNSVGQWIWGGNGTAPKFASVPSGGQVYVEFWCRFDNEYVSSVTSLGAESIHPKLILTSVSGDAAPCSTPDTYANVYFYTNGQVPPANTWIKVSKLITFASEINTIGFSIMGPAVSTPGYSWIEDIVVRRVLTTERFADGAITNAKISDVSGNKINSGTVGAPYISSLDASKVTSGTFAPTTIPSLDAGKITTGVFAPIIIPSLDASKIGSGVLPAATIPDINAGKLTSGTLSIDRIATYGIPDVKIGWDLDGRKISQGTVAANVISDLDASKITTGQFGTNYIANGAITGDKTSGLDASKITTGTVSTGILPSSLAVASVGSGINATRTTGAGAFNVSDGSNRFPTSFYNGGVSGTSDIVITTEASGALKATAQYSGWYMVDMGFGINQGTRGFSYTLAPLLFKGNSPYKLGGSADYRAGIYIGAFVPNNIQSSFIIYLNAGESANPGVYASGLGGTYDLIQPQSSTDTYFSIALLNRSLA